MVFIRESPVQVVLGINGDDCTEWLMSEPRTSDV
jgi:hypothetical protein